MRWLVGWSSAATGNSGGTRGGSRNRAAQYGSRDGSQDGAWDAARRGAPGLGPDAAPPNGTSAGVGAGDGTGDALQPVGGQLLWGDPDPLWAVGDWRPDEVRVVRADSENEIAVLGCCGATDEELRLGLFAARGGALRHLTSWPGSYTAVVRAGRRITIASDLAGVRPVFHTPWSGGTAYATAALPLADLIGAQLDIPHLTALLACPDAPEALGDGTPYVGVLRVPPGAALVLRDGGSREINGYEQTASLAVSAPAPVDTDTAVAGVRDALIEAVRTRLAAPRHVPDTGFEGLDPGPVPGMGPAERRAARGARGGPAPGIGADLSGGPGSGVLALLAAGLPGTPGTVLGTGATAAGERLLAVTFNDLTAVTADRRAEHEAELERARSIAENPRLHHVVVAGAEEALPYADLESGPLTDEPGPSLVTAERHRARLAAGSADHFVGFGARQVLDAHPARLADLLLDRRRRHLLRPVAALTRSEGAERGLAGGRSVLVPLTVYRAARRLARTSYREGIEEGAARLRERRFAEPGMPFAAGHGGQYEDEGRDGAHGADGGGSAYGGYGADGRHGLSGPNGPGAAPGDDEGGQHGHGQHGNGDGQSALDASLAALTWCRPGPAARWLTGEALAEVSVRLEAAARARPAMERPGERRARAALARQAADHRVLEQAAEIRDQRLHAPFYDNQVVRACRALSEAARVKPGARASVLRAVLAGAGVHNLPSGWGAPSSASQAASARTGLRMAAGELVELFDAPLLADAGLIEARVVRSALRAAAAGESLPLDGLADIVSTEIWLRRLLARRGTCWTGAAAPRRRAAAAGVTPAPQRPAL